MTVDHILKLIKEGERRIFPYATLEDIRLDLVPVVKQLALSRNEKHVWKDMTDMELFRSAGLYEEDKMSGKKGFNLAAILLFGKDDVIQSCVPGHVTDCLFRRENIDRYDDRLIVETNLIEAYDSIFEFIEKHTLDRFFIIGTQSVSIRSRIAREIVSNILVHREFTSSYRSRVIIERDRIFADNWSRPQFEGPLDPDNFTPRSKNPILAKFFVNIGRADELGSGVRNLYEYTKIYTGGAAPELIEGNIFKTIVPLTRAENEIYTTDNGGINGGINSLNGGLNGSNGGLNGRNGGLNGSNGGLNEIRQKILELIIETPTITAAEIATAIGITKRKAESNMDFLKKAGIIERKGSRKSGWWVVN